MIYENVPDQKYYGRIRGRTRGWGEVDYAITYENITKTAHIVDWEQVPGEEREGLGRSNIVEDLDQGIIFARTLGKTKTECAEEIGISRTQMYHWLGGEEFPDEESEQKVRKWLFSLRDILRLQQEKGRKTALQPLTESQETTPKTKKSKKEPRVKKGGVAPSLKDKDLTVKELTVKTLIMNKEADSEKD